MAGKRTAKDNVKLSVNMAASTESVLAPTNASVTRDTPERRAIKI